MTTKKKWAIGIGVFLAFGLLEQFLMTTKMVQLRRKQSLNK